MPLQTDTFELDRLQLRSGQGRRLDLHVSVGDFSFGGQPWRVTPHPIPAVLDVSRTTHNGFSLRLRFSAQLHGPCMRCLEPAEPTFEVDVREVSQPGGGEELQSPYVDEHGDLDLASWARDALALSVPDQVICREDCAGLCAVCGVNLNEQPDHAHEREPDKRWAKLSEIKFD
jgi:uncharacterized protein